MVVEDFVKALLELRNSGFVWSLLSTLHVCGHKLKKRKYFVCNFFVRCDSITGVF